jgi:hypothetical protein
MLTAESSTQVGEVWPRACVVLGELVALGPRLTSHLSSPHLM